MEHNIVSGTLYTAVFHFRRVSPSTTLEVYTSSPYRPTWVLAGSVEIDERGRAEWPLFLGATGGKDFPGVPHLETFISDIIFEVRTASGERIFTCDPDYDRSRKKGNAGSSLQVEALVIDGLEGGGSALLAFSSDPATRRERLSIELEGLPPLAVMDLLVSREGGDRGQPELVTSRRTSRTGRAIVRFGTADGASLPHGASSVRDLWHRRFRVDVDGKTLLEGALPEIGAAVGEEGESQ